MSIPTLDAPARERWALHMLSLMHAAEVPSQAELARRLSPRLELTVKTLKPYLTQLFQGDAAQLRSWFGAPERLEVLADELATSPFDLRAALEHAARPAKTDPWDTLFGGAPPPPIEPRLRGRDGRWAWVVLPMRDWVRLAAERHMLPKALCVLGEDEGEAAWVAEKVRTSLTPEGAVASVEVRAAPDARPAAALCLELVPWGEPELAQLAERPRLPSAVRAAVDALRTRLPQLGAAMDPLLRPRTLLPWLVAVSQADEKEPPDLIEHALEQVVAEVTHRSGSEGLRTLGGPFLCALMAAWSASLQPHERWVSVDREAALSFIRSALAQIERSPLSEAELRRQLQGVRAQLGVKPMRAALNELERLLFHDPLLLLDALVRGGLLEERTQGLTPADTLSADLLAARGLVGQALPQAVLHPHQGRLLRLMVAMGQDPDVVLVSARSAPPVRAPEAYQAAAFVLGAAPERCRDADAHAVWAGAVYAAISGVGRATPFGQIQLEPFELDRAMVLALRRLSHDAREHLPDLGSEEPLARLEALTPPGLLRFAELWGSGLPELVGEAAITLPAMAPFQVHPSVADSLGLGEGELIPLGAWPWRAERGDAQVQRQLAGHEGDGWALTRALQDRSETERQALTLRWLARAPAQEDELGGSVGWLWAEASEDLKGASGQALLALLRRLPRATVRGWIRVALLGPLEPFGLVEHADLLVALADDGNLRQTRLHSPEVKAPEAKLIALAEALADAELLVEIAEWGERLLDTPALWPVALSWPRARRGVFEASASAALHGFQRVDQLSELAAEAAHRLSAQDALRRRWTNQDALPELLVEQANTLALLSLATQTSEAAWTTRPPPEGMPLVPRPEADSDGRWPLTLREGPGERRLIVHDEAALAAARALCAVAEQLRSPLEAPLSDVTLDWIYSLVESQAHLDGRGVQRPAAHGVARARWSLDWRWCARAFAVSPREVERTPPRTLKEWFYGRPVRAGQALLSLKDDALLRSALAEIERSWAHLMRSVPPTLMGPTGSAVQSCAERLRAGGAHAERAWALATHEQRRAILYHLIHDRSGPLPTPWAHRAVALGEQGLVVKSLQHISPSQTLEVGVPWVKQATAGWARLHRALKLHSASSWPPGLLDEVLRWALEEPTPFGHEDGPAWWTEAGVQAAELLADSGGGVQLGVVQLREAATRLWPLALLMARHRSEPHDAFYPSLSPRSRALHSLMRVLISLEHCGPLLQTWRELEPSGREPGLRGYLEGVVLPQLELAELRRLRARRSGKDVKEVLRELLRRGEPGVLKECEALLRDREHWDVVADPLLHGERLPLHWVSALGDLLYHDPHALERVFGFWLNRQGAGHAELLRVLAALAEPVEGQHVSLRQQARALLGRELERLLAD
ncbi:MAG: hypothetical protein H6741_21710 [Alphaproteobacteria bacterium]|nr:hypothetical protein [Alphaproteobacteria bacterium]